ncbi:OXA-42 family oxacillin-hydrolyzing class D beta-lactamase OXA-59 [Paralimibaculum aggregatum]|uniref:OXA-42 family oxacillin-hydrolyzing class D beta-lactamase OXA-59 n=1 Tax=Paralimibaculum aggregatum TaxID=3036245 RepID=A0ABQ6LTN0_9RHOB|nr:penicillin-binding transpeptidase domain-containing protein [Limibaculum sp. NKW23]GMG85444.1 OXA-42 family oxacillin-hydrolyzing class D beta-lactamase OXA-59 [Limibaculum sp. NKW23]
MRCRAALPRALARAPARALPRALLPALALVLTFLAALPGRAEVVCTAIADAASGAVLRAAGDCAARVTPASTFKIPLAVMGFEAGILADAQRPVWHRRPGEPDRGGPAWRAPTDLAHRMRHSVVWYSQRIAARLGAARLTERARAFGYGNADFTGDPGRRNGLGRAWIASSLAVSPLEQVGFLGRLATGRLPAPAAAAAMSRAAALLETHAAAEGWLIRGKTGAAYRRRGDGSVDRARAWGWYVGRAERGGRRLAFARLGRETGRRPGAPGRRVRAAWLAGFPALAAGLGD